jgi:hypothetical protein
MRTFRSRLHPGCSLATRQRFCNFVALEFWIRGTTSVWRAW